MEPSLDDVDRPWAAAGRPGAAAPGRRDVGRVEPGEISGVDGDPTPAPAAAVGTPGRPIVVPEAVAADGADGASAPQGPDRQRDPAPGAPAADAAPRVLSGDQAR